MFRSVWLKTGIAALPFMALAGAASADDIVDVATGAGQFDTLVAAVQAAGLEDTLRSDGPFTVFAPTDEAFAALPEGTVESLLEEENIDDLVAILTYHVIPGAVMAGDLSDEPMSVETVQGSMVTIDASGEAVMVDEATVIQADIQADNGVIHVIDRVIMPSAD